MVFVSKVLKCRRGYAPAHIIYIYIYILYIIYILHTYIYIHICMLHFLRIYIRIYIYIYVEATWTLRNAIVYDSVRTSTAKQSRHHLPQLSEEEVLLGRRFCILFCFGGSSSSIQNSAEAVGLSHEPIPSFVNQQKCRSSARHGEKTCTGVPRMLRRIPAHKV